MLQAIAPMLVVADIPRARTFYEGIIGLKEQSSFTPEGRSAPAWASLRSGRCELMLSCPGDLPAGPASRAQLYLYVDDIEPTLARARAAGIEVRGPFVRFYQMKEIELRDPDGFLVIVAADTDEAPTPEED
jgi:catechol 2,3-dioxygenase-like lactoylglutathione lyase family enzyme